jgi:hypothetical protein
VSGHERLLKALRDSGGEQEPQEYYNLCDETAAEIERLRAKVRMARALMRAALGPIEQCGGMRDERYVGIQTFLTLTTQGSSDTRSGEPT